MYIYGIIICKMAVYRRDDQSVYDIIYIYIIYLFISYIIILAIERRAQLFEGRKRGEFRSRKTKKKENGGYGTVARAYPSSRT